jgi:hypothetical protein
LKARWPWRIYKRKAKRKASVFSAFFLPKYPPLHVLSLSFGIQIIRIGSSQKANGTVGKACLAKPSLERPPKAKTLFWVLLLRERERVTECGRLEVVVLLG